MKKTRMERDEDDESTPSQIYRPETEYEWCQVASVVLRALWDGMDRIHKRSTIIWTHFVQHVEIAATSTNDLVSFVSAMCNLLGVAEIGKNNADRHLVAEILAGRCGGTEEVLRALKHNPQVCVMLLRLEKDERWDADY